MGSVLQILGGAWAGIGCVAIAAALLHAPLGFGIPASILINVAIFILPGFVVGGFGVIVSRHEQGGN